MDNPFFKNNGPFKFRDILRDLSLENDKNNQDQNIIDIKDLQNSKSNEITFFHSKKYKTVANNTKASFCITTKNLQSELPKSCIPIIVDNVLVSTSVITAKFYPDSINDDFDNSVEEINNTKFNDNVEIQYLNNKITASNLDLNFEENIIKIFNNVVYDGLQGILKTDNVVIDLITKKTKIFMDNSNKKVKASSK